MSGDARQQLTALFVRKLRQTVDEILQYHEKSRRLNIERDRLIAQLQEVIDSEFTDETTRLLAQKAMIAFREAT